MKRHLHRLLLITVAVTLSLTVHVQHVLPFCSGCNATVKCGVEIYQGGTLFLTHWFEERAIDGTGDICNMFGCACRECVPDRDSSEIREWCVGQYTDDAKYKVQTLRNNGVNGLKKMRLISWSEYWGEYSPHYSDKVPID